MTFRLIPLAKEAILEPGFWKSSPPVLYLVKPPRPPRDAREPGLPEAELEVLWSALDALPNDDLGYDDWLAVWHGVHWATGGSDEGLERVEDWSSRSAKHVDGYGQDKIWDRADPDRVGGVTAATVFKMARDLGGWVNPSAGAGSAPDPDDFAVVAGWGDARQSADSRSGEQQYGDLGEALWTAEELAEAADQAAIRARNEARRPLPFESEADRDERVKREHQSIGEHGWRAIPTQRVMSGSEMLEECVFVADGSRVSFASDPRFVQPFAEFKSYTAGSFDLRKGKGASKVLRAQAWLEHPERKTVRVQTFAPGRGPLCDSPEGVMAQNLWVPRGEILRPVGADAMVEAFMEHVAYLVPVEAERERFLDWLAHIEQAPGVLPSTHYLFVTKQTGVGRNWMAYALARCFASYTALGFDLPAALASGFNGVLSKKLLAIVDELNAGGPGSVTNQSSEKLKSMLTEETRHINPKYGRQHTEFNCCRMLMFSNHESALPLADNDRRVIVVANPTTRREPSYYKRLYEMLHSPGFGDALALMLRARDLRAGRVVEGVRHPPFNPGDLAPMNTAKARTIRAGRSEIEQAVRDVAAEWPSDAITSAQLQQVVSESLGGRAFSTQGPCVNAGLVKYDGRVKVGGVASHVWVLRNHDQWLNVDGATIAAEVTRGTHEDFAGR